MRSLPCFFVTIAALTYAFAPALRADGPERPHAERKGFEVTIVPAGPRFEIPTGWVDWDAQFHNNLFATTAELDGAKNGGGEWDTEYAEVMNAAFDFTRCGFQGGGDGWGPNGCAFSDLQMRLYVLDDAPEAIEARLDDAGAKAVAKVVSPKRKAVRDSGDMTPEAAAKARAEAEAMPDSPADPAPFKPVRTTAGDWRRSVFTYDLNYGDYGATAHIDVRLRRFGGKTVAAVFCYTNYRDQETDIAHILASVAWANPPEGK